MNEGQTHYIGDDCDPPHEAIDLGKQITSRSDARRIQALGGAIADGNIKTSRWSDAERESVPIPHEQEAIEAEKPELPPPPPWLASFPLGSLVQHGGWWARIAAYGQTEDGEIGVCIVPLYPTKKATKRMELVK